MGKARLMDGDIAVLAPAKINLYLHVTGRRPNGYHELDSLVVFAGIGDVVRARPGDGLTLSITGPFADSLSDEADNLVIRAARALADVAGVAPHAALSLEKNLPVASGIGGGSADAAATLRAVSRLWDVRLDPARFQGLALGLGADVPVCLAGRPAFMSGIGECLAPAPALPMAWLVLVNSGEAISTPAVFEAGDFAGRASGFSSTAPFADAPSNASDLADLLATRRNDLETPARALVPQIGHALSLLGQTSGCLLARMSGSGATCFGLYGTETAARAAQQELAANTGWWAAAAPVLLPDGAKVQKR